MNQMRRWADLLAVRMNESLADWDGGRWVHYSEHSMLSINPKPFHQDPLGIYCFPEKFSPHTAMWPNMAYKFLLTLKPGTRILDFAHITDAELNAMLEATGAMADYEATNAQYPLEGHNENPLKHHGERCHRAWASMRNAMILQIGAGGRARWNKILRSLGWDAIFDDTGAIHSVEVQLLILDPRVIAKIERETLSHSGFAAMQQVVADLRALCAQYGTVSVEGPRKTSDGRYGPKILMAEVGVKDADGDYADFAVRHNPKDRTYRNVIDISLRWSRPSLGYGAGTRYNMHNQSYEGWGGRSGLERLGDDLAKIFARKKPADQTEFSDADQTAT